MIKDTDKVLPGQTAKTFRQMVWVQLWSILSREPNAVEYNYALHGFEQAAEMWAEEKNKD